MMEVPGARSTAELVKDTVRNRMTGAWLVKKGNKRKTWSQSVPTRSATHPFATIGMASCCQLIFRGVSV
jgi:exopolysaccharide biosynthesis protein